MRTIGLLVLACMVFLIFTASASAYAQSSPLTLKVYCNQINCSGSPPCNMTVSLPNSSILVNQQPAVFQTAFYSYNFTLPSVSGNYDYNLFCTNANSFTSSFEVTPNGETPTTAKAFFYLGLMGLLIFFLIMIFYAHMHDQSELAKFWWFAFMWIPIWAILFIGWNMARDFLTSQGIIRIVLYWAWLIIGVAYPFFLLGLVLYTFYYIYKQKEVQQLINRGFSAEDAKQRVNGRGRGMGYG